MVRHRFGRIGNKKMNTIKSSPQVTEIQINNINEKLNDDSRKLERKSSKRERQKQKGHVYKKKRVEG